MGCAGTLGWAMAIAGLALMATPVAEASNRMCSDGTLRGGYGFRTTGTLFTESGEASFAAVGRIEFDGRGQFTNVTKTTIDGIATPDEAGFGTYAVADDCTGTLTFNEAGDGPGLSLEANIVVVDNGREIFMTTTTPGVQLMIVAKKQ